MSSQQTCTSSKQIEFGKLEQNLTNNAKLRSKDLDSHKHVFTHHKVSMADRNIIPRNVIVQAALCHSLAALFVNLL